MATVSIFMQFTFHIGIIRISFVLILECVRVSDSTVYVKINTAIKEFPHPYKIETVKKCLSKFIFDL